MDDLKNELLKAATQLVQLLTLILLAYGGIVLSDLRSRAKVRDTKIEETRENVSRLVNGGGVAHDGKRDRREGDKPPPPASQFRDLGNDSTGEEYPPHDGMKL